MIYGPYSMLYGRIRAVFFLLGGSSREWRSEGVPTTDEMVIALLQSKYISAVDVRVVFCPH